jgi:nickel/cobalt exporter
VLLICLQLKHFALGATLVFSFSIGLALTLVASGAIAALSLKHATKRWPGFSEFSRKSAVDLRCADYRGGIYMSLHGLSGILSDCGHALWPHLHGQLRVLLPAEGIAKLACLQDELR